MLSAVLVSVNDDLVMFTFGDNYICFETESRSYSNTSQNIILISDSVNMLHCAHRRTQLLSLPNRNDGWGGVSVPLHFFLEPGGACVAVGL